MRLLYLFILLALLSVAPAAAQETDPGVALEIREALDLGDDKYVETSYENLSKLYWAIGKLDILNDEHIDNYLMINECDLYRRLRPNDLEWVEVREATREMIKSKMISFPTHFEVMTPIYLDAYDLENEAFPLMPESELVDTVRLDFARSVYRKVCGHWGVLKGYPANLIFLFNRPLTLTEIPVKRELAELYLAETRARFEELPLNLQVQKYERLAYLRVPVWMK